MVILLYGVKVSLYPPLDWWIVFAPFWVIALYVFLSGIYAIIRTFFSKEPK